MTEGTTTDVLIVGLGPAGASAARAAAAAGHAVVAVDRKREAGLPVQCAEFVPAMPGPATDAVNAARCQRILSMHTYVEDALPDLKDDFPGVMLDRATFDQHLVARASDAGAECRLGIYVTAIDDDGRVRFSDGTAVAPRVLIGADGPRSRVGAAIDAKNTELVVARQMTVPLPDPHPATDIFLAAAYRGGYAWLFPRGSVANLGLGVVPEASGTLNDLLADLHRALVRTGRVGADVMSRTGGAIPVGGMVGPHGRLGETLVLLCGDAAGLTNPVTGAGITPAVMSGSLAGESAADWLGGNGHAATEYAEELRDLFGGALARAVRRRRAILSRYENGQRPNDAELRGAWIAYPEYWAA